MQSIYLLYLLKINDKMKKINELTERFAMWFFRIKRKKTITNNDPVFTVVPPAFKANEAVNANDAEVALVANEADVALLA